MMKRATAAYMLALVPALLLARNEPVASKDVTAVTLPRGARIGIVNLLDSEVTHFHGSTDIKASFLKTHQVDWPVDAMLTDAVKQRMAQMGLEAVPMLPSEGLSRGRQDFFIDNAVSKSLPKACATELTQMAANEHLDAMIILAPGLNDSAHAGGTRRKDLPDYLRGWGFVTKAEDPSGTKPAVFNMTEMLLISARGGTALLRDVAWGGEYNYNWPNFAAAPDQKDLPPAELDKLKPYFAEILARQASRLFDHIEVVGTQ